MGCIKNPKSFWGIKYHGDHVDEIIRIGVHMKNVSDTFKVKWKCKKCGREYVSSFVSWDSLLHMGMTNEEIEKAKGNQI